MPKSTPVVNKGGPHTNMILTLIVLAVAVVVIGGVLLVKGNQQGAAQQGQTPSGPAVPAELLLKPDTHRLSEAPGGKVTVVEFVDYECPICLQYYHGLTKRIEQEYQGRITFAVRDYPLRKKHPLAQPAAEAANAAGQQGKFKEMYHALYSEYGSWTRTPDGANQTPEQARARFDQFATQLGLDLERFHRDMGSPRVRNRVNQDMRDGDAAGISGTPSFFINGRNFEISGDPAQDLQRFRAVIDRELGAP